MDGFGTFNAKASIRRKGAGSSRANMAYYDSLLAEAEYREAKENQDELLKEINKSEDNGDS